MGLHFYDDDYSTTKHGCDIISDITGKYLELDKAILFNGQVTELDEIVGEDSTLKHTYEKTHGRPFHVSFEQGVFKVDNHNDSFELLKKVGNSFLPIDSEFRLCRTDDGSFIFEDKLPFKLINIEDYLTDNNLSEYKTSTVKDSYTFTLEGDECYVTNDNGEKTRYEDFKGDFFISSDKQWITEEELDEYQKECTEDLEQKYKSEYDEFFGTKEYEQDYDAEYYPEDYE